MNTQELKKVQSLIDMWEEFRLFINALGKDTVAIKKLAEFNKRNSLAVIDGDSTLEISKERLAQLQRSSENWIQIKTWEFYGPLWFEASDERYHFLALRGEECIKHLQAKSIDDLLFKIRQHASETHLES